MTMTFNPTNPIIHLCMQAMSLEESGSLDDALRTFMEAWRQSSDDYERFISAYHLGLRQQSADNQLKWLGKSLAFALKIVDGIYTMRKPLSKCLRAFCILYNECIVIMEFSEVRTYSVMEYSTFGTSLKKPRLTTIRFLQCVKSIYYTSMKSVGAIGIFATLVLLVFRYQLFYRFIFGLCQFFVSIEIGGSGCLGCYVIVIRL